MKSSKFFHCIGAFLLGATVLSGCNKHPMLAMAEEADAADTQMGGVRNSGAKKPKKYGTTYFFEEPYACEARGNACHEVVPRVCKYFDSLPLAPSSNIKEFKTNASLAEETLAICKERLEFANYQLKNRTTILVKHQADLDRCQQAREYEKNTLVAQLTMTQENLTGTWNELILSKEELKKVYGKYQRCMNNLAPLPSTLNKAPNLPTPSPQGYLQHIDIVAKGSFVVGAAFVGGCIWKTMSMSKNLGQERQAREKEVELLKVIIKQKNELIKKYQTKKTDTYGEGFKQRISSRMSSTSSPHGSVAEPTRMNES